MICQKCGMRAELRDCTDEEIHYGLCWRCLEEMGLLNTPLKPSLEDIIIDSEIKEKNITFKKK